MVDIHSEGYCKKTKSPTILFFEGFEKASEPQKKKILAICNACQVKQACYDYAAENDLTGVFGGVFFEDGKPLRSSVTKRKFLESGRDQKARKEISARG